MVDVPAARAGTALAASLRPRQWTKNAALLAPLLFSTRATDPESVARALAGVVAFCLVSGAVYLANDVVDRERDQLHPQKRLRPVASGALAPRTAAVAAALVAAGGLAVSAALGPAFLACAAGYVALQAVYVAQLRERVLLDVFAIAAGFVLRVVAGAAAIAVPVSSWLYLCTMLLALFLALAKRRAEITALSGEAPAHRAILAEYSVGLLDQLVAIVAAAAVLAYALYTLAPETVGRFGNERLRFTVPLVVFGIFRYLYLVHRREAGGAPERVLFADRATQVNLLAYVAIAAWAVYGG
jgi:4-hydroxybenzoate polyprenyltransferase